MVAEGRLAGIEMGPVALTVGDLSRSLRFYSGLLGMRLLYSGPGTATVGAGDRPLLVLVEQPGVAPRSASSTGIYHFALLLPNRLELARVLRRLQTEGYPLRDAEDHVVSEALYVSDPDGIGVEIYRDRPPASWPWLDNGELPLESGMLNLDLADLLSELHAVRDSASWDGLPAGTRMGHVHLQVSDIDEERAFYCDLLGLRTTGRAHGLLFAAADGYHHHIGLNTWQTAGAARGGSRMAGLRYFTIGVRDPARLAALAGKLGPLCTAVEPHGALLLHDPCGNALRLELAGAFKPGGDHAASRELDTVGPVSGAS